MKDYQKRVVEEKKELDAKLDRLADFLNGDHNLSPKETGRMNKQKVIMGMYSDILAERIKNFV